MRISDWSSYVCSSDLRLERQADHLLGGALRVVTGLGCVGDATAGPVRGPAGAGPGATGALLLPRLRATATHLGAGLGGLRAAALGGELRGHDLVHDRDVRLDAEHGIVELDGARLDRQSGVEGKSVSVRVDLGGSRCI